MIERLQELRAELEKGRQRMQSLDRERQEVRDTMLRISGAIRVLEEMLEQDRSVAPLAELSTAVA
jgi:predicted nuclease with TOPRIM domain